MKLLCVFSLDPCLLPRYGQVSLEVVLVCLFACFGAFFSLDSLNVINSLWSVLSHVLLFPEPSTFTLQFCFGGVIFLLYFK